MRRPLIFIHSSDELYGADRMLLESIEALPAGQDRDVEVWLPTDLPHGARPLCAELARRGVVVRHIDLPIVRRAYRTPLGLLRLLGRVVTVAAALRAVAPSAVYCATSAAFPAAAAARILTRARVIGHVQEIWSRSDRIALGLPARACHRLLAISEPVAAALPAAVRRHALVVPNATPEPDRWTTLDGPAGPLRFVVASRWNGWKGHRTLLEAWDLLEPPGQLVVLGGPPPIGESVDVPALVSRLRRPESVTVVGEVPDPARYVDQADVVLVPSDRAEPFGLVAIEAFARGRPVVASAGGGLVDIVTDGQDGWLFEPCDVAGLAAVLQRLTRADVQAAGARARRTYEQRFTLERFAHRWRAATELC